MTARRWCAYDDHRGLAAVPRAARQRGCGAGGPRRARTRAVQTSVRWLRANYWRGVCAAGRPCALWLSSLWAKNRVAKRKTEPRPKWYSSLTVDGPNVLRLNIEHLTSRFQRKLFRLQSGERIAETALPTELRSPHTSVGVEMQDVSLNVRVHKMREGPSWDAHYEKHGFNNTGHNFVYQLVLQGLRTVKTRHGACRPTTALDDHANGPAGPSPGAPATHIALAGPPLGGWRASRHSHRCCCCLFSTFPLCYD